jgi:hypothetical protein
MVERRLDRLGEFLAETADQPVTASEPEEASDAEEKQ